jgi:hypothetical protein
MTREPNVAKTRELIELVISRSGMHADADTLAMALMVLDSHHLLRSFPGTPEEYHRRVQKAYADALEQMTRER